MSEALDDATEPPPSTPDGGPPSAHAPERTLLIGAERTPPVLERARESSTRGRFIRPVPAGDAPGAPIALLPTVRELARRRADDPDHAPSPRDLRASRREVRVGRLFVLAVDLSGSMGARARAEAATGSVLGLLTHAYQHRDQVALVGFRDRGAEVLLAPTGSIEVAHNRLGSLGTGGPTPLAEGIRAALRLATESRPVGSPLVVLLTDGRATGDADAMAQALRAASEVRRARIASLVIDCETGTPRLRLAARVADAMGARYADVGDPTPSAICSIIGEASDAAVS
jgi:magnesium chelatase subunit D